MTETPSAGELVCSTTMTLSKKSGKRRGQSMRAMSTSTLTILLRATGAVWSKRSARKPVSAWWSSSFSSSAMRVQRWLTTNCSRR